MPTRHTIIGLCVAAVAIVATLVVVKTATSNGDGPLFIESGMGYFDVAKPGQGVVFSEPPIETAPTSRSRSTRSLWTWRRDRPSRW
jgi:hypothetical protein